MTPRFLIATTHHLLGFDGQDQFGLVHSGSGLYYGLAQDDRRIYVSCRNQSTGPYDATMRTGETGSILVFDAASLSLTEEFRPEDFALRDVHGIACFDGKLWVTSSFDNLIAVFDIAARRWTKWFPAIDPAARNRDVHHFNTIVLDGERIGLLAHNNGPSHLLFYDRASLELCSVLQLGVQAHDIFQAGGGVATCSSAEGLLLSSAGWVLRTGAFPRGVAYGHDDILVGLSQVAPRSDRHKTSAIVRCFTPQWHHAADYILPGVGMVLAILPLRDASASATLEPFLVKCSRGAYNSLEPGNVYAGGSAAFAPEWHSGEPTHRWTGAREARMTVVVNPGETTLTISCSSSFPGSYYAEVFLNGLLSAVLRWSQPGWLSQALALPSGIQGKCELLFRVPHLWQPSATLGTNDSRMLGVSIQEVKLS